MRCECCDTEMEAVGTIYVSPQEGGLVALKRVNHTTGHSEVVEDLAPSEVIPQLLEWGMDKELIEGVERDLPKMYKGGA